MRKSLCIFFLTLICHTSQAHSGLWQQVVTVPSDNKQVVHPDKYLVFSLQSQSIKNILFSLSENPSNAITMALPSPDGSMKSYKVWQESMMEPELAAKFPEIKTFTAVSVDNPNVTAKLDFTTLGFHAMVYDGEKTYFIDPYTNPADNYYLCYYKHDVTRSTDRDACGWKSNNSEIQTAQELQIQKKSSSQYKTHGGTRYTYRLALACTGEYSVFVAGVGTPSVSKSMSAMTTSMNRVNGVYEREVGVHMNLVANNNLLVYLNGASDPYDNNSGPTMETQNQTNCNTVIGTLNYDMGHVFSTNGGGIAELGCVCNPSNKAMGVTGQNNPVGDGFDIDYVVHEMGHQFGAEHSFNANVSGTGSCTNNANQPTAYEPGGGSTIMAYAGICAGNNLQQHSDDYFHATSLTSISDFLTSSGSACAATSSSGNTPPSIPSIAQTYNIPYGTPFELIAMAAVDADHDWMNYCWEEWDLGDYGETWDNTKQAGPIFSSFKPQAGQIRIFPTLDSLRKDVKNYLGEKLPEVSRPLKFKLTVRDMLAGYGTFNISDDEVTLNVTNSSGPFEVLYPNWITDYLQSGANATITWKVANTTAAPVSCANVDIMLSTDDGATFPYTLVSNTPNDGSETVAVPAGIYSAGCRVKVKGSGNVFFDMSNEKINVFPWPSSVACIENMDNCLNIYPVPAKDVLHIDAKVPGHYEAVITDILGKEVWKGNVLYQSTVNVSSWSSGVYSLKLINTDGGGVYYRKVMVQ